MHPEHARVQEILRGEGIVQAVVNPAQVSSPGGDNPKELDMESARDRQQIVIKEMNACPFQ
jgi:hypothetical protein